MDIDMGSMSVDMASSMMVDTGSMVREEDRQMLRSEAARLMCAPAPVPIGAMPSYFSSPEDLAIAQFHHLKINAGPKYLSLKQQQQQMDYLGSPNSVAAFPQTPLVPTPLGSPTNPTK